MNIEVVISQCFDTVTIIHLHSFSLRESMNDFVYHRRNSEVLS